MGAAAEGNTCAQVQLHNIEAAVISAPSSNTVCRVVTEAWLAEVHLLLLLITWSRMITRIYTQSLAQSVVNRHKRAAAAVEKFFCMLTNAASVSALVCSFTCVMPSYLVTRGT